MSRTCHRTSSIAVFFGLLATVIAGPANLILSTSGINALAISETGGKYTYHLEDETAMFPSPTLRMQRCGKYTVSLKNNLAEFTNLHTHGLHISGDGEADDVLLVTILPGETHTYTYNIPCNHATGVHWYHPHGHGNTADQLAAGAAGALIIEDASNSEGAPSWLTGMREEVVLAQDLGDSYIINGESNPTITMAPNEWVRFRIVHASSSQKDYTVSLPSSCEGQLLGKDGVLLPTVPRQVDALFIGSMSSRADVAVRCSAVGTYSVGDWLSLSVQGLSAVSPTITPFAPCRPAYLTDVGEVPSANKKVLRMGASSQTIDGSSYSFDGYDLDPARVAEPLFVGEAYELSLSNSLAHPAHFHVNHVQLVTVDGFTQDGLGNWCQPGDWVDTHNAGGGVVRFIAADFNGKMVMHCHVSGHSDKGGLAFFEIQGNGIGPTGQVSDTAFTCSSAPTETCDDGIQNQDETGVDCGGSVCSACGGGGSCLARNDRCSASSECCTGNCRRNGRCA